MLSLSLGPSALFSSPLSFLGNLWPDRAAWPFFETYGVVPFLPLGIKSQNTFLFLEFPVFEDFLPQNVSPLYLPNEFEFLFVLFLSHSGFRSNTV